MRVFVGVLATLALIACVGTSSTTLIGDSDGSTALNSEFSGTWVGPVALVSRGRAPLSYTGEVVIAVSGTTAKISNLCSDGTGSVMANGSGDSISWSGNLSCPMSGCSSGTQTFTSIQATLNGNMLSATGDATMSGCGQSYGATITITATKQ